MTSKKCGLEVWGPHSEPFSLKLCVKELIIKGDLKMASESNKYSIITGPQLTFDNIRLSSE